MEIEAKFIVSDREMLKKLKSLTDLAGYTLHGAKNKPITDSYLDTPARDIYQAGYALRRRKIGAVTIMSLKGLGGVEGAIHRREELEADLPANASDTTWHETPVYRKVATFANPANLETLFQLSQERLVQQVMAGERLVAESSLDAVTVTVEDKTIHFFELEVELKPAGTEADLHPIATYLETEWGLVPSPISKFQRALQALG